MEIAMYYGFPNYYDEDLKKTFEDYLLLPHTYYEFAKGRMPNKYTEGMGTFEDPGEGMKPNKYTKGMGTLEDQGEGMKPNKYTKGMDVDLEALTDPDGYILGGKGAGLSQRESSVSVNMLQNQDTKERKHKCFKCRQRGHVTKNCPVRKHDEGTQRKRNINETAKEINGGFMTTKPTRVTPSSRCSRSGDHRRSRRDSPKYDRHESRVVSRLHNLFSYVGCLFILLMLGYAADGLFVRDAFDGECDRDSIGNDKLWSRFISSVEDLSPHVGGFLQQLIMFVCDASRFEDSKFTTPVRAFVISPLGL
nr:hypothetical protein [Tanacetum cinerariifolium]